jgi:hypothetical protein
MSRYGHVSASAGEGDPSSLLYVLVFHVCPPASRGWVAVMQYSDAVAAPDTVTPPDVLKR